MRSVIWLVQNCSASIRDWHADWNHSCYGHLGSVTITPLQMSSSLNGCLKRGTCLCPCTANITTGQHFFWHMLSQCSCSPPECFLLFSPVIYRGDNPFATVKLKPTSTNDRSAPRIHRRWLTDPEIRASWPHLYAGWLIVAFYVS